MKRMLFLVFILCTLFICTKETEGKEVKGFILHGDHYIIGVPLTDEWTVDMEVAQQHGINGYFYLMEDGINNSPVVIIVIAAIKPNNESTLEEYIQYDLNGFQKMNGDCKVNEIDLGIKNKYNYKIKTYYLSAEERGMKQYVAFIDGKVNYMLNIYIQFKDEQKDKKYIEDFIRCVNEISLFNAKKES